MTRDWQPIRGVTVDCVPDLGIGMTEWEMYPERFGDTVKEATCSIRYHEDHRSKQYDARGIFLTYTCPKCHEAKMAGYREDVLTDPNYWTDEPVDEE